MTTKPVPTKLLTAVDDSTGAAFDLPGKQFPEERGNYTIGCAGTFDSATCAVQISLDDGTTWMPLQQADGSAIEFTVAGAIIVLGLKCDKIRGVVSGSTTAASLTLWIS